MFSEGFQWKIQFKFLNFHWDRIIPSVLGGIIKVLDIWLYNFFYVAHIKVSIQHLSTHLFSFEATSCIVWIVLKTTALHDFQVHGDDTDIAGAYYNHSHALFVGNTEDWNAPFPVGH